MHQDDMESRIRNAVEHVAPDPLENILSSRGSQENAVRPAAEKRVRKKTHWTSLAAAAVLALICCGGFAAWQNASAVASVISLDVNPSIQLEVNKNEKVLSATPMNDDGAEILDGMDLKGTQARLAVLHQEQDKKKPEEITEEEKKDLKDTEANRAELRKKRNGIVDDYAKGNKVIHQLIDLALLQNGMLTGAALDTFIKRSVGMIKE